ncbi:hypothetical protein ABLG96_19105 [Nakamurella sp. A5-74]|uniref:Lipoprotein LpqN n=1 Tax=Nakamurella sp. A5-74 TaxID=3158264 RepID=A0AAU8DLY4_9ACTN
MDTNPLPSARRSTGAVLVGAAALVLSLAACSAPGTPATGAPSGQISSSAPTSVPLTESNPPGDIPDNQAFVPFTDPSGAVTVKVPEGWARTAGGDGGTTFTDKLNSIALQVAAAPSGLSPAQVRSTVVAKLTSKVPAFALGDVQQITRSGSPAVLVTYQGDSAQDPVTGKVIRDAFELYVFFHNGTQVLLTLTGPANADNVDPWRIVSDSITWP